ncbi:MAG: type II toxin-antitoxin system Phd/YefM family antitoxin [Pseudomonadota bacterium]
MAITTLSSRELNQDLGRAKKAAQSGPVVITDRGKPAHVLLSFDDYQRLTTQQRSIVESIAMTKPDNSDFDPPRVNIHSQPAEL